MTGPSRRPLDRLLDELDEWTLWRAILVYLGASYAVLEALDLFSDRLGLPDWLFLATLILLLVGLPIVGLTAAVQHRVEEEAALETSAPGTDDDGGARPAPPLLARLFTWRNALGAGVLAFGLLGLAVGAYFTMATLGVGPVASLVAQGVLQEGDELVLADFESATDRGLADMATEALRVDLAASPTFRLVEPSRVRRLLRLMEREAGDRLAEELAREVAIRAGAEAVVVGEVGPVGSGYLLLARIVGAEAGNTLASLRVSVDDESELIQGLDRLSAEIRTQVGESLRSVRAGEPLREVTTASLPALQSYTAGIRAFTAGDAPAAAAYMADAIGQDSGFAMAYRALGPALQSSRATEGQWRETLTRAYELRERLTPMERYLAEASYHDVVSKDVDAELFALERILEIDPDRSGTHNNYGRALAQHFGRFQQAADLLARAIEIDGSFAAHSNLVWLRIFLGDMDGARTMQEAAERSFPESFWTHRGRFLVEYHGGTADGAHAAADSMATHPNAGDRWRSRGAFYMSLADIRAGRVAEARRHLDEEVARALEHDLPHLALTRTMDRVWLEGVVLADTAAARRLAADALETGWLEMEGPERRPYFPAARDAARVHAVDAARGFLDRWSEPPAGERGPGYAEDRAVAEALLAAAEGDVPGGLAGLRAVQEATGPRFTVDEWPSAHHCQRCFTFDLGRLSLAAGDLAGATRYFEDVLARIDDMVETPLNRILASEHLGALYEARGDDEAAREAYRRLVAAWGDAEPPLAARAEAARRRVDALRPGL